MQWSADYGRSRKRHKTGRAEREWSAGLRRDPTEYVGKHTWYRIWNAAVAEAKLPFRYTPYQVRHSCVIFASWLIDQGVDLERVRHRLGHGDLTTTTRYVKILDEEDSTAADVNGPKTLPELFDGRSQLIVYHFMFGPSYTAGCPTCSSAADTFNGAVLHLNARDVTFTCISRAPLDKLQAYKRRMGWSFPWASSHGNDYNFDLEISRPEEATRELLAGGVPPVAAELAQQCGTEPAAYLSEGPVMSTYALANGTAYLTYSTTARGLEFMMAYYGFLDRAPLGRNEGDAPMRWLRRHDEYGTRA